MLIHFLTPIRILNHDGKALSGFGARHINDHAPFSLWNEEKQDFRTPTAQERRFIAKTYNVERLELHDYLMVIETSNPPKPVPLTVACIPAIFVPPISCAQGRLVKE
jgi:hypothetical protein